MDDRNDGMNGGASEDNTEAVRRTEEVRRNHDALEESARRVEASAGESADHPVEGYRVDGMGSEDTTEAEQNQREVQENREALEAQARRVDASAPPDVNRTGPPSE